MSLPFLYREGTDGFRLGALLASNLSMQIEEPLSETLREILSQPFYYLSSGTQSYVFESEDGNVVLKLFRRRRPSEEQKILAAAKIAYCQAREETALLYCSSSKNLPSLKLFDRLKRPYTIELHRFAFAIQKKGKNFRKELLKRLAADQAEPLIASYLQVVQQRASKGICNRDISAIKNFGILDGQAIEIDFGSYYIDSKRASEELARFEQKMRSFIQKYAPQALPAFEETAQRVRMRSYSIS